MVARDSENQLIMRGKVSSSENKTRARPPLGFVMMLNHILNSKLLHFNVYNEIFTKNIVLGPSRGCFMASSDRPRGWKSVTGPDIKHRIRQLKPPGAYGMVITSSRRAQPAPYLINTF